MLRELVQVEIVIPSRDLSKDEIEYFIKQEEVASLAADKFVAGEISLQDYCDVLEVCDVDMDEYLDNLENNLRLVMT